MHLSVSVGVLAALSTLASGFHIPRFEAALNHVEARGIEARGQVDTCKAILIALKASAFCSKFVPITDSTSTATQTGTAVSTQVTVTAPCTNPFKKKRQISTTPAAPSTTPRAPSTTPAAPSTTPRAPSTTPAAPSTTPRAPSTTPAAPSTTPKAPSTTASTTATTTSACKLQGVPSAVQVFACEIIKDACLAFVKPKTVTVTTFQPGPTATGTKSVTPTCPITTTRVRQPSTTPATTPSTTPSTTPETTPPTTTPSTTPGTTTSSAGGSQATCAPKNDITVYCDQTRTCTAGNQCVIRASDSDCANACQGNCIYYDYDSSSQQCQLYSDCC